MFHPLLVVSCLQIPHNWFSIREKLASRISVKEQSELTVKSSRAWAPLLSFLASAECMVMIALINRFSNSIVSIKSEFLKRSRKADENHTSFEKLTIKTSQEKVTISNFGPSAEHHESSPMLCQLKQHLQEQR